MNWRQFFATIVHSVVWPVAVITIALVYRQQLIALLGKGIRRAKVGPLEIEWDSVLEKARSDLARGEAQAAQQGEELVQERPTGVPEDTVLEPEELEAETPEADTAAPVAETPEAGTEGPEPGTSEADTKGPGAKKRPDAEPEGVPTSEDIVREPRWRRTLDLATRMVKMEPRSAVIIAFSAVEDQVAELATEFRNTDATRYSVKDNTSILVAEQQITPATAEAIRELQHLRNLALHGISRQTTSEQASEFVVLTQNVLYTLSGARFAADWSRENALVWSGDVARALDRVSMNVVPARDMRFDFVVLFSGVEVLVILKHRRNASFTLKDLSRSTAEFRSLNRSGLIVTNASLSPAIKLRSDGIIAQESHVAVVTWNGRHNDVALVRALTRLTE